MSGDDVLQVNSPVEELVRLGVVVSEVRPQFRIVVFLKGEPRSPQHETVKTVLPIEKLAQILGGRLRDTVDVLRNRSHLFRDPGRRLAHGRPKSVAEHAGRAGKNKTLHASPDSFLKQHEGALDVRLHEVRLRVRSHMRLVERRCVKNRSHSSHRFPNAFSISD